MGGSPAGGQSALADRNAAGAVAWKRAVGGLAPVAAWSEDGICEAISGPAIKHDFHCQFEDPER